MTTSSPDSAAQTAPEVDRLPLDAETYDEVLQYYKTRALQFASEGYYWSREITPIEGGYLTHFTDYYQVFPSFYVTASNRGKGMAKKIAASLDPKTPIITMKDCNVSGFFKQHNIPFISIDGIYDTPEYKAVEDFYGNGRAKRSRVLLMNHIDEGLFVMYNIGASVEAMKAFCLHPLLQNDVELSQYFEYCIRHMSPAAVALAIEYRNQANLWLSDKVEINDSSLAPFMEEIGTPTAGPLLDVRHMLIADKVQNYKDFIAFHRGKHARTLQLDHYFKVWLKELSVDNFEEWEDAIISLTRPA